jgi:uncharacterized protein YraI
MLSFGRSRAHRALVSAAASAFLALCLVVAQQQAALAQEQVRTYRVVNVAYDDVLNIRSGPSAGHAIVGSIPPRGRGVRILGNCRGWCPIQYNGMSGWVNGAYLAAEPAEASIEHRPAAAESSAHAPRNLPAYWRVTGVVEGETLKVHDGPSPYASVVHAFASRSGCIKLAGSCRKPWCQVAFPAQSGERVGWVDSRHLTPSDASCSN